MKRNANPLWLVEVHFNDGSPPVQIYMMKSDADEAQSRITHEWGDYPRARPVHLEGFTYGCGLAGRVRCTTQITLRPERLGGVMIREAPETHS